MGQEAKHTPGPWRAVRGDDMVFVEAVNIAHIGVTNGEAYEAPFVIQAQPGSDASHVHNALLIAAAPDLLEALSAAITGIEGYIDRCNYSRGHQLLAQAHAAIAKATAA